MPRLNEIDWLLKSVSGPVTLFDKLPLMEEAAARFERNNYIVHRFDCSQHESEETLFNTVLHSIGGLNKDYFYKNINSLQFWDLLRGIDIPEESGVVLAFAHFDEFHRRHPDEAYEMLNSLAREHFHNLWHGFRLLTLAHSEDRDLKLEPLLTIEAEWSRHTTFTEEADIRRTRYNKYYQAEKEANQWLESRIKLNRRYRVLTKALLAVTGASDTNALMRMELDGAEMIRLLKDFDFSQFEIDEESGPTDE